MKRINLGISDSLVFTDILICVMSLFAMFDFRSQPESQIFIFSYSRIKFHVRFDCCCR